MEKEDIFLVFKNFYFICDKSQIYIITKRNIDAFKDFYLNDDNEANHSYYSNKPRIGCALFWDGLDVHISIGVHLPLFYNRIFDPRSPSNHVWEKFVSSVVPFLESDPDNLAYNCLLGLIEQYDYFRFVKNGYLI